MTTQGGGSAVGGGASGNTNGFEEIAALLDPLDEVAATSASPDAAIGQAPKKRGRPRKVADGNEQTVEKLNSGRRRPPQRDAIMGVVGDCLFWHGRDQEAFVSFKMGGRTVHFAVRSNEFRRWLCTTAWRATGEVPNSQAVEDGLRICEAMAHEGPEDEPLLRVGAKGARYWVDLCDADWNYVDVSPQGWQVCADGVAKFIRTSAMRPLPMPSDPETTAGIETLRPFVNVASEQDFVLLVGWLLGALRPVGPYALLIIGGQQGAGKSVISRLLRYLVDPNAAPIRAAPKDCRDLIVAAINGHCQVFDNLSRVDNELSDALCRLATGGGFSSRQLHTDRNEMIFYGQRPVILNGIPALAERADLADRALGIRLVTLDENTRRTEADFWSEFEAAAPDILSALFDAMVIGLRNLPTTKLERPPRLADFATWVTACEPGLGWESGTFMRAFESNRHEVNASAFEADTIAVAIRDMVRDEYLQGWEGTPTTLLGILNTRVSEEIRRARSWPFTAQALGSRVDRAAPLLRAQGIIVERRHSGARFISIVPAETASNEPKGQIP